MNGDAAGREAPGDVRELLERIDAAWSDWLAHLDDIPEARWETPGACGEWSVKHLMGHLAFWDGIAIGKIERALAGLPGEAVDFQPLNEADHAARLGRSLAEERSAMHQGHAELVEQLEGVAGIEATAINEAISVDTYDHYAEHVRDIEGWRQREGL